MYSFGKYSEAKYLGYTIVHINVQYNMRIPVAFSQPDKISKKATVLKIHFFERYLKFLKMCFFILMCNE